MEVASNSGSSVKRAKPRYDDLFNAWWSIFFPLYLFKKITFTLFYCFSDNCRNIAFKSLYIFYLAIFVSTIVLPLWSIVNNILICYRDYMHVLEAIRTFCSVPIVLAMIFAAWKGRKELDTNTYCPACYFTVTKYIEENKGEEMKRCKIRANRPDSGKCKKIITYVLNLFWNFFYTWICLLLATTYLTVVIPILNPHIADLEKYTWEDILISIADFILSTIRVYHNIFFCIICDRIHEKMTFKLKQIVDSVVNMQQEENASHSKRSLKKSRREPFDSDEEEHVEKEVLDRIAKHLHSPCSQDVDHKILTRVVRRCICIKKMVSNIDKKIRWFILFGIAEFIVGFSAPAMQLISTLQTSDRAPTLLILLYYSPWLFIRFLFMFYTIYKAYNIPSTYRSLLVRFKNAFTARIICVECPDLKKDFLLANDKFFKKPPCFSLGGMIQIDTITFGVLTAVKILFSLGALPIIINHATAYDSPSTVKNYYITECFEFTNLNGTI